MSAATMTRGGWGLLAALTFLNILNFADRYLLIAFSTAIVPELKLTNFEFGLLTGVVFTVVYTGVGMFAGSLADRFHRPRLIAAGLALWSLLTAATGLARSFVQMALPRMLIGVGEACLTPSSMSLLADRFPPARRALASGVYYMGYPLGIGGSFIFAGIVGPTLGWRGGFIVLGVIGVVAALLVFLLARDPSREHKAGGLTRRPVHSFADSFRGIGVELRDNRAFALTLVASTAFCFALGAGILDLLWWVKERGYAAAEGQKLLGLVFLVGGSIGALGGGAGGDWAHVRFGIGGRLKFLAAAIVLTLPFTVGYRLAAGHTGAFVLCAFVSSMVSLMLFGPAMSGVQEQVSPTHRASAVALLLLCTALLGGAAGNAAVGWLADAFTAAAFAEPLTVAILAVQSVGLLAIPLFWLAARAQARSQFEQTMIAPA
jgi:MFS transporter, Spinster family, sphingosine-1-phosphate transporter